jgi:flagellar P-ring protein precursor FlgI
MRLRLLITAAILLVIAPHAFAMKVADITRMDGARTNVLTGMGLVIGLKGTGDGGSYLPAMKPLAQMLKAFADPSSIADLSNASNVAVVNVIVTIPANGVRNGDHLDVRVMSNGAATSLKNGTLYMATMKGPGGEMYTRRDAKGNEIKLPYAIANGQVELDDATAPLSGLIRGGAVMEADLPPKFINNGHFTLIISDPFASWDMSSSIAKLINESNDSGDQIAIAVDPKNVIVQIPASERERPDGFIAGILKLPVPRGVTTEARVRINSKTGTIIVTGDVEIDPVVISHKGLTITTITPPPVASARNPLVATHQQVVVDTTGQAGAHVQDLANAFDQLKVPAEDRIDILEELYETGKLHAKLTIDGKEK